MNEPFTTEMIAEGVLLNINPEIPLDNVKSSLESHLEDAGDFYRGADLYLNLKGISIESDELQDLIGFISQSVSSETNVYFSSHSREEEQKGLNRRLIKKDRTRENEEVSFKDDTRLVRGTLRSGQAVEHPHNVVILGDVNPGAEVRAGGDILVFGKLMGLVHAGVRGDEDAEIAALRLTPTQIRIASKISRPPENETERFEPRPERAFIETGRIIVEEIDF